MSLPSERVVTLAQPTIIAAERQERFSPRMLNRKTAYLLVYKVAFHPLL
jgi:hypothetical protein